MCCKTGNEASVKFEKLGMALESVHWRLEVRCVIGSEYKVMDRMKTLRDRTGKVVKVC